MTSAAAQPRLRRRLVLLIATPVLALIALLSWGLSSPVGASPDDDFHLASIWCGHGDAPGCEPTGSADERSVYRDLVIDSVCFAFNSEVSASCHGADFGQNPDEVVDSPRGNFTGLYPPLFYGMMSLFASENIESSVLVLKLVNSVIFVGLVAALFWLLPAHRRTTLVWSLAITLVPLGMFVIPSTNPSSWAVLSAGTLWLALLGVFESTGRRRIGLGAIALVATMLGAGARADAAIYAGLSVALVLLLAFRRDRGYLRAAAFGAALLAIAIAFYFTANQRDAVTTGLVVVGPEPIVDPVNPIVLALANVINVPELWAGIFGAWPLGWLDTAIPASVWVAGLGCFCGAIFLGLGARVPRKGLSALLILGALWAIPTLLLVQSQSLVGANFQPRYILPLMIMLAGVVLLQTPASRIVVNAVQRSIVVAAISLANAVALYTNIRRYVTGTDVTNINLDADVEWWWQLPFSPMFVWIVGSLAFAAVLIAINSRELYAPVKQPVAIGQRSG